MTLRASALAMEYAKDPHVTSLEKVVVMFAADWATCDDDRMVMWLGSHAYQSIIDALIAEYPEMSVEHVRFSLSKFGGWSGYSIRPGAPSGFREMQSRSDLRGVATPMSEVPDKRSYVYLMRSGDRHKIGITRDIERRVSQLGRQAPYPLEVVHSIRTLHPKPIENILHRKFDSCRAHGEWFDFDDDDIPAVIEAMNDAVRMRV